MNTAIISPGASAPYHFVARAAGLEEWALAKLEPEGFRTAENIVWANGIEQLTPAGILELADVLERRGYAARAHTLRVLARAQQETPSRQLITEVWEKNAHPVHEWQRRADING